MGEGGLRRGEGVRRGRARSIRMPRPRQVASGRGRRRGCAKPPLIWAGAKEAGKRHGLASRWPDERLGERGARASERERNDALTRAEQGGGVGERRDENTDWRKLESVQFGSILDAGILLWEMEVCEEARVCEGDAHVRYGCRDRGRWLRGGGGGAGARRMQGLREVRSSAAPNMGGGEGGWEAPWLSLQVADEKGGKGGLR